MGTETLVSACYILSNEKGTPFYSTSNAVYRFTLRVTVYPFTLRVTVYPCKSLQRIGGEVSQPMKYTYLYIYFIHIFD